MRRGVASPSSCLSLPELRVPEKASRRLSERSGLPPDLPAVIAFAELHLYGLGCGKFPITMWLGAKGARMQFARFLGSCTTSRTRHGQYLFQCEILGFHYRMMQRSTPGKCSILIISIRE